MAARQALAASPVAQAATAAVAATACTTPPARRSNSFSNTANGTIVGGVGLSDGGGASGADGAGVYNAGTIGSLSNSGSVKGGGRGTDDEYGAAGAGVYNTGAITTLTNGGSIEGGVGGGNGNNGGDGVYNSGTIGSMTNSGSILGGAATDSGAIGDGLHNVGAITTLTNSGSLIGGSGPFAGLYGGTGIYNSGTIGSLTNSGSIKGGAVNGTGEVGDAIYSAGTGASIGTIANSGQIVGNVEIDNQANVTVIGGATAATAGVWSGGTITVGAGNLTFASGYTKLTDNITVNGGAGTVYNGSDPLNIAAPITIHGNFDQGSDGELDFLLSGASTPPKLDVTGTTLLGGLLVIDLATGYTIAPGDEFDLLSSEGDLSGAFGGVTFAGDACGSSGVADQWLCSGAGVHFDLVVTTGLDGSIDLTNVVAGVVTPVPEPSTWALMGLGFAGLGFVGYRSRKAALIAA